MDFCHLQGIYRTNIKKGLLDTAAKTGLDATKTASKKVVHKNVEAAGELIENEIAKKLWNLLRVQEMLKK